MFILALYLILHFFIYPSLFGINFLTSSSSHQPNTQIGCFQIQPWPSCGYCLFLLRITVTVYGHSPYWLTTVCENSGLEVSAAFDLLLMAIPAGLKVKRRSKTFNAEAVWAFTLNVNVHVWVREIARSIYLSTVPSKSLKEQGKNSYFCCVACSFG